MDPSDEFAVLIARAFLREEEDAIQVTVLDALVEDANRDSSLAAELQRASASERSAGAFGMEIAGAIVVPILIKIGQDLWSSYSKELTANLGRDMASLTADRIKGLLRTRIKEDQQRALKAELEDSIQRVGAAEKLSDQQICALISAVRDGRVFNQLNGT